MCIRDSHLIGLDAVDVGRNHRFQAARNRLGMAAHFRIDARHVFGPAADLLRQDVYKRQSFFVSFLYILHKIQK